MMRYVFIVSCMLDTLGITKNNSIQFLYVKVVLFEDKLTNKRIEFGDEKNCFLIKMKIWHSERIKLMII